MHSLRKARVQHWFLLESLYKKKKYEKKKSQKPIYKKIGAVVADVGESNINNDNKKQTTIEQCELHAYLNKLESKKEEKPEVATICFSHTGWQR